MLESVIFSDAVPADWPVTVNEHASESVENDSAYVAFDEYDSAVKLNENAFCAFATTGVFIPAVGVLPPTGLLEESFLHPAAMHVNNNVITIILFIANVPFGYGRAKGATKPGML